MKDVVRPKYPRRRLAWAFGALVALAVLAAGGWYGWLWYTTPAPPDVPLEGVEPAVAQAIEAARAKVRGNGRSAAAWGELGKVLLAHEFNSVAGVCFARAERLDPNEPRWPYFQGLVRIAENAQNPEESIPFFQQAADLCDRFDRGNSGPRLLLAETLLQTRGNDEAEAQLRRVQEWDPDNPRLQFDLATLALARHDEEAAARYFLACSHSPYTQQRAFAGLAAIRERQGDTAGAAEYSRQAFALPTDPNWNDRYTTEYLNTQVVSVNRFAEPERLEAEGRLKEALPLLLDLARDASDPRAQIAAGTVLYKMKRYDEAEHYFRTAVGLKTEQTEANYFLALALYGQGEQLEGKGEAGREAAAAKYREALACADKTVELKPDHALAHHYRGLALNRLGRKAEAMEAFRQAVRCRPDLVDGHLKLGEALAASGQKDEAVAELRRAVAVAPTDDPRPREALERALAAGAKPK